MTTGRVREDPAWENGVKFVTRSHNAKMGGREGSGSHGELLVDQGLA